MVAILVTDGEAKVDVDRVAVEAKIARDKGITLFAVGVGNDINTAQLENITADPSRVTQIADFDDLMNTIAPLIRDVCRKCSITGESFLSQ